MRRFDSKLLSVSSSVFLRFALGISFLSAVGDRFGLWGAFAAETLLGVLLLLGWQTRIAALLSGVLLLLFALTMTGALGIKVPWTPPSSPQQVERFFWPVAGNTHSALIITGEIRLEAYSLVSEVRALEGPSFCRGIRC